MESTQITGDQSPERSQGRLANQGRAQFVGGLCPPVGEDQDSKQRSCPLLLAGVM